MNKKIINKLGFPQNNPGFDIWGQTKKWMKQNFNKRVRRNSKNSLKKEVGKE